MPVVSANDINLYYESHGQGEPLVLITGLSYSLWYWHRLVPLLARDFQVITFDNRGIGQSDSPPGPYSAPMMAADTASLLDELGLERAHFLGHSMGGFIAQALALTYPERVERLILASTNFGGPRQIPPSPEAMAILTDVSGDPVERFMRGLKVSTAPGFVEANPEFIGKWLEYRARNPIDPVAYQSQLAVGLGLLTSEAAFDGRLRQITAPALLLWGEHDTTVPPANAELMAAQLPHSQVVILPNAGHHFPIEVPGAAAQMIAGFLLEASAG